MILTCNDLKKNSEAKINRYFKKLVLIGTVFLVASTDKIFRFINRNEPSSDHLFIEERMKYN